MKRAQLGAIAAALLLVSAALVVSAGTNSAVGSSHTSDTDFNNAATLDNVTVEGNGASANVSLAYNTTVIDSVEDQDFAEYTGDSGQFSAVANSTVHGSYVGQSDIFTSGNGPTIGSSSGLDAYPQRGENVTVYLKSKDLGSGGAGAYFHFGVQDETAPLNDSYFVRVWGGSAAQVGKYSGGSVASSTSGTTLSEDTWYEVEVSWESDGDIVATWRRLDGTVVETLTFSDSEFDTGGVAIHGETGSSNDQQIEYDYAHIGDRVKYDQGRYVSANHSVSNASQAWTNLTLNNASATVEWQAHNGTGWETLDSTTYTTGGNKTVAISTPYDTQRVDVTFTNKSGDTTAKLHDEGVLFTNDDPAVDNASASPSGGAKLDSNSQTLEIDINDSQFGSGQGETVDVTFYTKAPNESSFTQEGTDTLNSNGTASTSGTFSEGGTWEWYVEANDSHGGTTTSQTFEFNTPDELRIVNETSPSQLVDNTTVTITFFNGEVIERTTDNGTVSLQGLPVDKEFTVVAEANGYYSRTVVFEDIYSQQTVYLLATNQTASEVRFQLDDQTGNYPESSTRVIIEKPINESGNTTYRMVASDQFGVNGFSTHLEKDVRHQVKVKNDEGDTRVIGHYTAPVDEEVTITVGELSFGPWDNSTAWEYDASYKNSSTATSGQKVVFNYTDPEGSTENLHVVIYERGNESNELANNTFSGPYGEFSISRDVPDKYNESEWVVEFSADRNGETIGSKAIVGPRKMLLPQLDDKWKKASSIMVVLMTAALFSAVNASIGAVVVSIMASMLWYIGWLGGATSAAALVIAIGTSIWIRYSRDEPI